MKLLLKRIIEERVDLWSFFSTSALNIIVSFILLIAFANLIDEATLGVYQYLIAAISIISAISLTGAQTAIIRAASKHNPATVAQLIRMSLFAAVIPVVIGLAVGGYYLYRGNYELATGISIGTIVYMWLTYLLRYNALYVGLHKFQESNAILRAKILAPAAVLTPALLLTSSPAILAILYFGSSALALLITIHLTGVFRFSNQYLANNSDTKPDVSDFSFALHQSVVNTINVATAHIDKIIIFQLLGAPATAAYYIAVSIPDRIRDLVKQLDPYLFAKFASYNKHSSLSGVHKKFMGLLAFCTVLALGYAATAPIFFMVFLPQYTDIISLTLIYGVSILAGAALVPYSALKAHGDNKLFYQYTIIQSIIKISAIIFGGFVYGLPGVIVGATISSLCNTFILYFWSEIYRKRHTASIL